MITEEEEILITSFNHHSPYQDVANKINEKRRLASKSDWYMPISPTSIPFKYAKMGFISYLQAKMIYKELRRKRNRERYYERTKDGEWIKNKKECLKRDNKCRICQSTENLNVHHIIPFDLNKDNLNIHKLNNLITLCEKCHIIIGKEKLWIYLHGSKINKKTWDNIILPYFSILNKQGFRIHIGRLITKYNIAIVWKIESNGADLHAEAMR